MPEILIDETDNEQLKNHLKHAMMEFNATFFGKHTPKPFTIYINDSNHQLIAGVTGFYYHKYARIDYAWVHEAYRKQGLGKQLFARLERFLSEKHCQFIQLDTFDFQAKPFYEKLGFHCVGTISKWVGDHDCYFMRKELKQGANY
jgi:ribosomal protein S18 acetylase RimI-like enzyme